MKNVRFIRQSDLNAPPSTELCPVIWAAVRRNGGKARGTFVPGFEGASRKVVEAAIGEAVAKGAWKKGQLRAARVADCRGQQVRQLGATPALPPTP
jgi:hypothetical protein